MVKNSSVIGLFNFNFHPPSPYAHTVGDGRQGYPEEEPYDAIHVGAAASTVPQAVSSLETV